MNLFLKRSPNKSAILINTIYKLFACNNSTFSSQKAESSYQLKSADNLKNFVNYFRHPGLIKVEEFSDDLKNKVNRISSELAERNLNSFDHNPAGLETIRKDVANYIEDRDDGMICYWQDIYFTENLPSILKSIIEVISKNSSNQKPIGFLSPTQSFSANLYSNVSSDLNVYQIKYKVSDDNDFEISLDELENAYKRSLPYAMPKILILENPSQYNGNILNRKNVQNIIKWVKNKELFLIIDERLQTSTINFEAVKKIAYQMGPPYSDLPMASLFENYSNEYRMQANFVEIVNVDPDFKMKLNDRLKFNFSSIFNQIFIDAYLNEPKSERENRLKSLEKRAKFFVDQLNSVYGIECKQIKCGNYVFPKVNLPIKSIRKAQTIQLDPMEFYCSELFKHTGLVLLPVSKLGELPNNTSFRVPVYSSIEEIQAFILKLGDFQKNFFEKWA